MTDHVAVTVMLQRTGAELSNSSFVQRDVKCNVEGFVRSTSVGSCREQRQLSVTPPGRQDGTLPRQNVQVAKVAKAATAVAMAWNKRDCL